MQRSRSLLLRNIAFVLSFIVGVLSTNSCLSTPTKSASPQSSPVILTSEGPKNTDVEADRVEVTASAPVLKSAEDTSLQASPTLQSIATPALTFLLDDAMQMISRKSLLGYLEDLTTIQAYSGWRNSATQGEAEGLDYITNLFGEFEYLNAIGMQVERQTFGVFNATELWETRLLLDINGREVEVPTDGLRGNRDDNQLALRFDSDGSLGDTDPDPIEVEGSLVLIENKEELYELTLEETSGKILFLNYQVVSKVVAESYQETVDLSRKILALRLAGIVLITKFSNTAKDSHGEFVGDSNAFMGIEIGLETPKVPILYIRFEDLLPAGIETWQDLTGIEKASLIWDADVLSPGISGNLVVTIPGVDRSRSVILSAHIDSPNSPGALDDGSGSVVLMEVGRIINAHQTTPPVDVVLVWYGSEEIGLYGSSHFVATHQELLDQTLAMLQIDCLTRPLDEIKFTKLELVTWSSGRFGDERTLWPDYLADMVAHYGIETLPQNRYEVESDNTPFGGFNVPNANMIYRSPQMKRYGPIHYAGHLHSPYDTVEVINDVGQVLEQMAQVALTAAVQTGIDQPQLNVSPEPEHRAVIIASHTEAEIMSPVGFTDFGIALAMEGYDVDMIPYGQTVTPEDLMDADLVVAMPLLDFATDQMKQFPDEAWSSTEIEVLKEYVSEGGFLILTNSARRIKINNWIYDPNEDWFAMNALAEPFGVHYTFGSFQDRIFWVEKIDHPLLEKVSYMELIPDNAIPIRIDTGTMLAPRNAYRASIGLTSYGAGEVLALADVGILGNVGFGTPENLNFWVNMARYAYSR